MNALDTNVLVRYLVQDDVMQAKLASDYIRKYCTHETPGYINRIVLCELVWVLESNYAYPRKLIVQVLGKILQTRQFMTEDSELAWLALDSYKRSKADFADSWIGILNKHAGYAKTVTFDKDAAKSDNFLLLTK